MGGEANIWNPRTLLEVSADTKRVEQRFTAVAGQTLFTITDFAYVVGTGALEIHSEGLMQAKGVDWVEGASTTFSLVSPAVAGAQVVAVGYVAITGDVDVRDTDIFIANYQSIRDYVGTEITLYSQGTVTAGDNGESFFQKITGAAPGFYVDDNDLIIVPTGGDGSIGWVKGRKTANISHVQEGTTFNLESYLQETPPVIQVPSVAEGLYHLTPEAGWQYNVASFHIPNYAVLDSAGGGSFIWKASLAKTNHDGIFTISPTVPPVSAQAGAALVNKVVAFLAGTGEEDAGGNGCFVRTDKAESKVPASWGGATKEAGFDNALLVIPLLTAAKGRSVQYGPGNYEFYTQITLTADEFRDYGIEGVEGRPVESLFWEDMTTFVVKVPNGDWFLRDEVESHFGARLKSFTIYGENSSNGRHGIYLADFRNFELRKVVTASFDRPLDIGIDETLGTSFAYYSIISEIFMSRSLKGLRVKSALNGTVLDKLRISGADGTGQYCVELSGNAGHTAIQNSWLEGGDTGKIYAEDLNHLVIKNNWLEFNNIDLVTSNIIKTVMTHNECHRSSSTMASIDLSTLNSQFEFSSNRVRNRTTAANSHFLQLLGNAGDPEAAGTFIGKDNTFIEQATVDSGPGTNTWWFVGNEVGRYIVSGNVYETDDTDVTYTVTRYFDEGQAANTHFYNNLTVTGEPAGAWPAPLTPTFFGNAEGAIFRGGVVLQSPDGSLFKLVVDNAGVVTTTDVGDMIP